MAFAEMLPYVLACALGGPLIDRIGARRTSIVADVASVLAVAAVPLLHRVNLLNLGTLVGLVAVAGLLRGFGNSAKRVVFPETVAGSGTSMDRAASIQDGLSRLATLLGASLAGLLIAAFDAPTVLLLDAATFAVGAAIVAYAVRGKPSTRSDSRAEPASAAERSGPEPYLVALRGGVAFLRQDRLMCALVLMLFVTNLADAAYGTVLAPVWANELIRSPVALGFLSASFGIGAVLGNLVFTAVAA